MSLEKSELLNTAFVNHANDLDKMRESAKVKMQQMSGAAEMLRMASKKIAAFVPMIKEEVEKEDFDIPSDPAEFLKFVIKWVGRSSSQCVALAEVADSNGQRYEGQLRGLDIAIGVAKKRAEAEAQKASEQKASQTSPQSDSGEKTTGEGTTVRSGNIVPLRPSGVRPGQSIADERKRQIVPKNPSKRRRKKTNTNR